MTADRWPVLEDAGTGYAVRLRGAGGLLLSSEQAVLDVYRAVDAAHARMRADGVRVPRIERLLGLLAEASAEQRA